MIKSLMEAQKRLDAEPVPTDNRILFYEGHFYNDRGELINERENL